MKNMPDIWSPERCRYNAYVQVNSRHTSKNYFSGSNQFRECRYALPPKPPHLRSVKFYLRALQMTEQTFKRNVVS